MSEASLMFLFSAVYFAPSMSPELRGCLGLVFTVAGFCSLAFRS